MIKVTITGTIPTAQYANMQPVIEAEGKSFEEAQELALTRLESIWNRVCEPGKELKVASATQQQSATAKNYKKLACAISGVDVFFDEDAHAYFNDKGERYLSGSVFASKYKSKFNSDAVSANFAKKNDVPQQDILDMWSLNGDASSSLGTAVHNALELYGKYLQLSLKTKGTNESALNKNELLKPVVESFFAGREDEDARYELFVADEKHNLCGFIDRLLIVDAKKKICRIQDYKTNHNINKAETILEPFKKIVPSTTLGSYWLQLSFYAYIMQQKGWTVEGLDIFNLENGQWTAYTNDVIDISSEIEKE